MRTLVIGDIHGAAKALEQVLKRCKFDPKKDKLIQLGDVADGWTEVPECVDILLDIHDKAAHLPNDPVFIRGNHDVWMHDYIKHGMKPHLWTSQGGQATLDGYNKRETMTEDHVWFWTEAQQDWYVDKQNRLFIHAGWNYTLPFPTGAAQPVNAGTIAKECHWDRELLWAAKGAELNRRLGREVKFNALDRFHEVYIGHTADRLGPKNYGNLWNIDTGAGWHGHLTIMDIDTKEVWKSDPVTTLYPHEMGRR